MYYNLKGTTQPFFQIGKKGATLYPGADDPANTYAVIDGDIWCPPNRQVKVRDDGEWRTILFDNIEISGNTISSIDTNGDIIIVPDGTGDVLIGNEASTETVITAPDEQDLFIEAGQSVGAADGGDLYLRGGEAQGTGQDGDVLIDRGRLYVDGHRVQGWTNTVTATSKTLAAQERCFVTDAGQTITLPATPDDDTEVAISVVGSFTDTILARNGELLMGLEENMTIDQPNITVYLVYVNSMIGWRVV